MNDPINTGFFGNSARGNLAVRLSQNYDQSIYGAPDEANQVSCHPDFAALKCAAYFQSGKMDKDREAKFFPLTSKVSPIFLTDSKDVKFHRGARVGCQRVGHFFREGDSLAAAFANTCVVSQDPQEVSDAAIVDFAGHSNLIFHTCIMPSFRIWLLFG